MDTVAKPRGRRPSSPDPVDALVEKTLKGIVECFRKNRGSDKRNIDSFAEVPPKLKDLGNVPFQQTKVVDWLWLRNKPKLEGAITKSALKTRVHRYLALLKDAEPDVAKVFRFKPHKCDVKSPNLDRASTHSRLDELQKRIEELETFKRRVEAMLATGCPESNVL